MNDSNNNSHFAIAYCIAMTAGLALVLLIHSEAGPKVIECVKEWQTLIEGIMTVGAAIWAANKAYKGIQEQIKQTNAITRAQILSRNEQKIAIAISAKQKIEEYIINNDKLLDIIKKFNYVKIVTDQFITESNGLSYKYSPDIIENLAQSFTSTKVFTPILNTSRHIRALNKCRDDLEIFLEKNKGKDEFHTNFNDEKNEKFSNISSASSAVRASLNESLKSLQSYIEEISKENKIIDQATK